MVASHSHDDADRLTEIHHRVTSSGATILKLEYEYVDDRDNPDRMIRPPEDQQVDGRPLIWRSACTATRSGPPG